METLLPGILFYLQPVTTIGDDCFRYSISKVPAFNSTLPENNLKLVKPSAKRRSAVESSRDPNNYNRISRIVDWVRCGCKLTANSPTYCNSNGRSSRYQTRKRDKGLLFSFHNCLLHRC